MRRIFAASAVIIFCAIVAFSMLATAFLKLQLKECRDQTDSLVQRNQRLLREIEDLVRR